MTSFIRIPKYEWTKNLGDHVNGDVLIGVDWIMFVWPTENGCEVATGQRIFQTPLSFDHVLQVIENAKGEIPASLAARMGSYEAGQKLDFDALTAGKWGPYIIALEEELGIHYESGGYSTEDVAKFMGATPMQKARAFEKISNGKH